MNILGVGGTEAILIVIIMLIVAGPKRMARWAYVAGTYVAKFRAMWSETVDVLQKEFDDAGVDVKIPKDLPTRGSLNKQVAKYADELTRPVKETMEKATAEVGDLKKATAVTAATANKAANGAKAATTATATKSTPTTPKTPKTPPASKSKPKGDFGAWSGDTNNDFGSWSGDKKE